MGKKGGKGKGFAFTEFKDIQNQGTRFKKLFADYNHNTSILRIGFEVKPKRKLISKTYVETKNVADLPHTASFSPDPLPKFKGIQVSLPQQPSFLKNLFRKK